MKDILNDDVDKRRRLLFPGKEGEEGEEPSLKNLSFIKRAVNSLYFVTDARKLWIFPIACYEPQEVGDWPEDAESPEEFRLEFTDHKQQQWRLILKAGPDRLAFGVLLAKFAAGQQGMMRPRTEDIASITLEGPLEDQ